MLLFFTFTKKFMRIIFLFLLLSTFFVSCNSTDYTINISADLENDKEVFLIAIDENNQPKTVDTLRILDGIATYSSKIEYPEMHYLLLNGNRDVIPIIVESGNINVQIYKDSIRSSKATGTKSNKEFRDYIKLSNPIINDLIEIQNEMRNAMISRDSLLVLDTREQLIEMQDKFNDFQFEYVKSNPKAYLSALILEELIATGGVDKEQASEVYVKFSKTLKSTKAGKNIKELIKPDDSSDESDVNVGDIAPDFSAPNISGEIEELYLSKGKYTIVDFWASWCGPCRVDNPNLVKLYDKFKPKGLEIFGVSLDIRMSSWTKAIENDKLSWNHVSNLKRWDDPIAENYGVESIPQLFLIDENSKVIAKVNEAHELLPYLEKVF